MSTETRLCRINLFHLQDKPQELEQALEKLLKEVEEELAELKKEVAELKESKKQHPHRR